MKKYLFAVLFMLQSVVYIHATMNLTINKDGRYNMRCTYAESTNTYTLTASGKNAYVPIDSLTRDLTDKEVLLTFEYNSYGGIADLTFAFGNEFTLARKTSLGKLAATGSDYVKVTYNLTSDICAFKWGHADQVLRIGIAADERLKIRDLRIEEIEPNVQGTISCNGVGVEDVVVSDGYVFTRTNEDGKYSFYSDKKNGYVFYEIPSGYMPVDNSSLTSEQRIFTRFWKDLSKRNDLKALETVNFQLQVENNTNFRMLVGADPQMSNRNNDVNTFRTLFFPCSDAEYKEAMEANVPI